MQKHANVILLQPLGVRDQIFPWGIHFIGDHLEDNLSLITVKRLLLQRDKGFTKLFLDYGRVGKGLLALLNAEAKRPFGGPGGSGAAFDIAVYGAWLGSDLLQRLRNHDCYIVNGYEKALSFAADLDAMRRLFLDQLDKKLHECFSGSEEDLTICGMSVYDRTLFFCLSLAHRIRSLFPAVKIVFGGDYFTFDSATALVRESSLMDGIVVGYGEEAMRGIIEQLQQGADIRNIAVKGFANANSLQRPELPPPIFPDKVWMKVNADSGDKLQMINVPEVYKASAKTGIQFVRSDDYASAEQQPRTLRVMFQRGCSYGECTFCTQIDKKLYFRLNHQDILASLAEKLAAIKGNGPIKISFDADEHAPKAMLDIMDFFASDMVRNDVEILVTMWFQAKYMSSKIVRAIANLKKKKNVHIIFNMNFETLNPATLALMDKGHSPLTAIFGAKAIQDSGQYFVTNYMEFFPGEHEDSVAEEHQFLHRSLHLVAGKIGLFPYSVNGRDDLYQNQEKYFIKTKVLPKDIWLRDIFGLNFATSIWNYTFDLVSNSSETAGCWQRYMANPSEETKKKFEESARRENAVGYLKRARDFAWLHSIPLSVLVPSPVSMKIVERPGVAPAIHKDYKAATGLEREVKPLADQELKVLRFLYQPRSWKDVLNEFGASIPEESLMSLKKSHQTFGSSVEHGDLILSTANDTASIATFN